MEAQAPAVVAVVVTRDPGPWLEETLRALARQDYPELSVLVLGPGGARTRRPVWAGCSPTPSSVASTTPASGRRPTRPSGWSRGPASFCSATTTRAAARCRRRHGRGVVPFQRRHRDAEVRALGRPTRAPARRDERRQDRRDGRTAVGGRDRPRPARQRAGRVRGPRGLHAHARRSLRRAGRVRPGHRRHGGGPRPELAGPGGGLAGRRLPRGDRATSRGGGRRGAPVLAADGPPAERRGAPASPRAAHRPQVLQRLPPAAGAAADGLLGVGEMVVALVAQDRSRARACGRPGAGTWPTGPSCARRAGASSGAARCRTRRSAASSVPGSARLSAYFSNIATWASRSPTARWPRWPARWRPRARRRRPS